MKHYEIVFLVHPDQSDQTSSTISKLEKIVNDSGGHIHRSENIGNRKLAYPIQDQFKASYGLLNVECNQESIEEIKNSFRFNDLIIRHLVINSNKAHTENSALLLQTKEDNEKDNYHQARDDVVRSEEEQARKAKKIDSSSSSSSNSKSLTSEESVKKEEDSKPEDKEDKEDKEEV